MGTRTQIKAARLRVAVLEAELATCETQAEWTCVSQSLDSAWARYRELLG